MGMTSPTTTSPELVPVAERHLNAQPNFPGSTPGGYTILPNVREFGRTVADARKLLRRAVRVHVRVPNGKSERYTYLAIPRATLMRNLRDSRDDFILPVELETRQGCAPELWVGSPYAIDAMQGDT